jgi:hypothetical protein
MNQPVPFAKARLVVILVLLVSTLQSVSGNSVAAADWAPATPPQIYDPAAGPNAVRRKDFIVDVCTTDVQLDCVESVAAYLNGAWVEGEETTTVNNGTGNIPNSRNWQIPGIVNLMAPATSSRSRTSSTTPGISFCKHRFGPRASMASTTTDHFPVM